MSFLLKCSGHTLTQIDDGDLFIFWMSLFVNFDSFFQFTYKVLSKWNDNDDLSGRSTLTQRSKTLDHTRKCIIRIGMVQDIIGP